MIELKVRQARCTLLMANKEIEKEENPSAISEELEPILTDIKTALDKVDALENTEGAEIPETITINHDKLDFTFVTDLRPRPNQGWFAIDIRVLYDMDK